MMQSALRGALSGLGRGDEDVNQMHRSMGVRPKASPVSSPFQFNNTAPSVAALPPSRPRTTVPPPPARPRTTVPPRLRTTIPPQSNAARPMNVGGFHIPTPPVSEAAAVLRSFAVTDKTLNAVKFGGLGVGAAGAFSTYNNMRDGRYGRAALSAGATYGGFYAFANHSKVAEWAVGQANKLVQQGTAESFMAKGSVHKYLGGLMKNLLEHR